MFRIEEVRKSDRAGLLISSFGAHIAAMVLVFIMVLSASDASARRPPTPQNFRVTARTAYTVTLAWDPAPPNSGEFNYNLWGAYNVGPTVILPKNATSYTFTALFPSNSYTFGIFAKNGAGQTSTQVTVSGIVLPRDTTPPSTAPIVSIDEVGANYARISWIPAQDDGPHLSTQIYLNGAFYYGVGRGITNATLRFLQPSTTYSLTARAIDFGNNVGPFSNPIALATTPANPNDTTAPTTPANLYASGTGDGSTETHISWSQSTDDFDAQSNIRYDVYLNGVLQDVLFGSGGVSIIYAEFGENLIEVTATDTAGNASAPATFTIFF
jgi:fibronectin type III domain protein